MSMRLLSTPLRATRSLPPFESLTKIGLVSQEEAEANVRKAKQNYNTRNSEYQKAKEAKLKADQQLSERTSGDGSHTRQVSHHSN